MIKMGTEFVMMLSSVGYDFAEKEGMSTIAPRHIISALVYLGYGEYVEQIEDLIEKVKVDTKLKVCTSFPELPSWDDDRANKMDRRIKS